jgi:hypothetical protein
VAAPQSRSTRPIVRNDVGLVPFPFTDLSTTKWRPMVVVWTDPMHIDFTLAFISSQQIGSIGVGEVALLPTHPEFALTGLSIPSNIRVANLVTLSRIITAALARTVGSPARRRPGPCSHCGAEH